MRGEPNFERTRCGRSVQITLPPVEKIAVACALHDRLPARERDVRTKAFGHQDCTPVGTLAPAHPAPL